MSSIRRSDLLSLTSTLRPDGRRLSSHRLLIASLRSSSTTPSSHDPSSGPTTGEAVLDCGLTSVRCQVFGPREPRSGDSMRKHVLAKEGMSELLHSKAGGGGGPADGDASTGGGQGGGGDAISSGKSSLLVRIISPAYSSLLAQPQKTLNKPRVVEVGHSGEIYTNDKSGADAGGPSPQESDLINYALSIRSIFDASILHHLHPATLITLQLTLTSSLDSASPLPSLVNCATLALVDAGIGLKDLPVSVSVSFVRDVTSSSSSSGGLTSSALPGVKSSLPPILVDVTSGEVKGGLALAPVVFCIHPSRGSLLHVQTGAGSRLGAGMGGEFEALLDAAVEAGKDVANVIRETAREHLRRMMKARVGEVDIVGGDAGDYMN